MKKITKIFLVIAMLFTFGCVKGVSAAEIDDINVETITHGTIEVDDNYEYKNIGVSEFKPIDTIISRGTSVPSQSWNLVTKGDYPLSVETAKATIYSNYYLTGSSEMNIWVTSSKWYDFTIELWKEGGLLALDSKVATMQVGVGKVMQYIITGLNSSSKYYVKVPAPAYFDGYVSAD